MSINTQSDENIIAPDLHSIVHKFKELPENDQLELIEETSMEVQEVATIEKFPEESENDFKLRKFTELFYNLPLDFLLSLWFKDKLIWPPEPILSSEDYEASKII